MTSKTWSAAARRWHAEGRHRAHGTIRRERRILEWVQPHLSPYRLDEVRSAKLLALRGLALSCGWSPRSANYMTQTVRSVLRASIDWEWMRQPVPRIKPLPLPPPRERWLTPRQAQHLVEALPHPISEMCALALETGLRRANITGLVWDWVDLENRSLRIPAKHVKSRRPLVIPLTPEALAVLRRQRKKAHGPHVFHRDGKPVHQPNGKAWRRALKHLHIHDFRWHDLRHTWASWHVQAGTRLEVLQQLGGWRTIHMVLRYAHLDVTQGRKATDALTRWKAHRTRPNRFKPSNSRRPGRQRRG